MKVLEVKSRLLAPLIKWLLDRPLIRSEFVRLSTSKIFRHAVATPISTLNLSSSLLRESGLSKTQSTYLDRIVSAADYIGDLVNQVSFSENQSKIEYFDLDQAISQIISLLENDYLVITQTSSYNNQKRCHLVGTKILFQEAFSCILSNAIQAYPDNDLLKPIVVATHLQGKWVRVDIIDLGVGMNKQQLRDAQMPGLSSKNESRGWGLPFARQVIELQFAGKLEMTSLPDRGTRATMLFPRKWAC